MTRIAALFITLILCAACQTDAVYHRYESLPGHWDKERELVFELPPLDSLGQYNLFLQLRNNNDYAYSNIYLITHIHFPNGKVVADTLEYEIARPDGSWLGTGSGAVKESKLWFKENIRFFEAGTYSIHVRHAMRNNQSVEGVSTLKGITDVGLRVEKVE